MDGVETGLALFGEIGGGFVGDDLRVCASFELGDAFCGFGWKALSDIVCFYSSVTLKPWRVTRPASCAKLSFVRFEDDDT